ncbi:MAG: hypothetical protein HYU66_21615 [Armatimonadetes bacterium]|nr:hypothetical protein [Armatimonadota bacterium]
MSKQVRIPERTESAALRESRRAIRLEDGLILVCLASLWLLILGHRGPAVTAVLCLVLVAQLVIAVRRFRRVGQVITEQKEEMERLKASGGYPFLPGMLPPQERPESEVVRRRR